MDYVTVSCCYYQNANGANFDRIKVNIDETGTSYTYDDDGNLISAKDNAGRNESYSYNNASDMTKLTTADNKAYKFTYSDTYKHRMLSATSESSGVKNSFTYDGSYVKTSYDKLDKSTDLHYKFNGQRRDIYFDYSSKDNLPLRVKFGTNSAYVKRKFPARAGEGIYVGNSAEA